MLSPHEYLNSSEEAVARSRARKRGTNPFGQLLTEEIVLQTRDSVPKERTVQVDVRHERGRKAELERHATSQSLQQMTQPDVSHANISQLQRSILENRVATGEPTKYVSHGAVSLALFIWQDR